MASAGKMKLSPDQVKLLEAVEARATASNTLTAIQDSHRTMFETLSDSQRQQFKAYVSSAAKP